jgi:eukaryotic-like serine/threonine-protein kinase
VGSQNDAKPTLRPKSGSDATTTTTPAPQQQPPTRSGIAPAPENRGRLLVNGELVHDTYEIRKLLGAGGMAEVFEAYDRSLERVVAIKVAAPNPNAPPLLREAAALAKFRHSGLVTVHHAGVHRGMEYVVMERVYGATLADHIQSRREREVPFRIDEVLDTLAVLAEALAVVHRAGLAHRDVKPGNVMLTPDGRVVLMDFGLVLPELEMDLQRNIAGSPPYMAPEAVRNELSRGQGHQLDIYALGVICFEMLVGRHPFVARTVFELMMLHEKDPPSLADERADAPPRLVELVAELLARNPVDRAQSVESVAWELRAIRNSLESPSIRPRSAPRRPLSVLIVEDDLSLARTLTRQIRQIAGADTVIRNEPDGVKALAALRTEAPDLMLLDIQLPRMNGIEVCMYMRGEKLAPRCRLIAMSGDADPGDIALLHQLGMHHFIAKDQQLSTQLRVAMNQLFSYRFA